MVNFPNSFDDDTTLYVAVNNLRTRLSEGINDSVTTIPVLTTSGYPTIGYISILTGSDITRTEAISYTNTTDTSFTGATRGTSGTPAAEHNAGDNVDLTIVAEHHNELKDAILNLEHFVGVSGLENFVPQDDFGNVGITGDASFAQDVVITGTLRVEDDVYLAQNVTVSGTLDVQEDADFKEDVTVTGVVQVGTPEFSTDPQFIFVSDETITNVSSVTSTPTGTGLSMPALPTGENLLFFRMNMAGQSGNTTLLELACEFDGDELGRQGTTDAGGDQGHWDDVDLSGFKIVEGDAAKTAELLYNKSAGGSTDVRYGTQGLLSIPLEQMSLTSGTEYFYTNGSEVSQTLTSNGFVEVTHSVMAFNVTTAGEYLMIGSCEGLADIETLVYYYLDAAPQNVFTMSAGTSLWSGHPFIKKVTLSAGAHTASVQAATDISFGNAGHVRRGRLIFILKEAFDNIVVDRNTTPRTTTSNSYVPHPGITPAYSPNQQEQLLVLGQAASYTAAKQSHTAFKLHNSTTSADYMADAGGPQNWIKDDDLVTYDFARSTF